MGIMTTADPPMSVLTILGQSPSLVVTRVWLPGGATVRIGGHQVHVPAGQERVVGPCATADYEIVG
jgi:hypothetical protein